MAQEAAGSPSPSPDATAQAPRIVVRGAPVSQDDMRPKLDHIMREVSGTEITVTKKATVIKLDQQPPVENNNLQEEFNKAPGLIVSEQQSPGQFNFTYRGLGNPQESEFTLVLQDGLPLEADFIGFPTLYYTPVAQSVSEIQLIRGGSSLLYGPEPAPAINFVTKHPAPNTPWNAYFEQTGGGNGFYNTYGAVQEANGPIEARFDSDYQHSEGQRDNGQYDLWQANGYIGYRPDDKQLLALDFHASRFEGGDPGRLTLAQFDTNQDYSPTPYNEDWVDRYTAVLRYEWNFGDGWLLQAKGWYTHEELDSRAAGNITPTAANPSGFPTNTLFQYEEFNNGGIDIRFRKKWGDDGMFRGSVLTFGAVGYYGDAPFDRYTLTNANYGPNFLYAPRDATSSAIALDQSRHSSYEAFFAEDLIRIGSFHIIPSFRIDHENVEVDSTVAPYGPGNISADHFIPLWGIGIGNDFGHGNETYFSASSGWRPTRYFDIAGTSRTIGPGQDIPDPFHSLDIELGVHGTPIKGLWYDLGLFWMEFSNRTETLNISSIDFIIQNTGSTRHRGFEGEISYDLLAPFQHDLSPEPDPKASPKEMAAVRPWHPLQLIVFSNLQVLDATFTDSNLIIPATGKNYVGNTPAYAPDVVWKGGITFKKDECFNVTFSGTYVSDEFWQDSNQPLIAAGAITVPAIIPSYKVFNLSGEYNLTKNVKIIGGISNLTDEKYYSRVFLTGTIEPAPSRTGYAGLAVTF